MQIEIQIPKAVLFDVKYTVEQATNFAKKQVTESKKILQDKNMSIVGQLLQ